MSEQDQEEIDTKLGESSSPQQPALPSTSVVNMRQSIRLSTIDNFQGEEALFVIVSMVRSNDEGKIGFLKTFNRVNVMLSRAKHGMFIIGSASTILEKCAKSFLGQ